MIPVDAVKIRLRRQQLGLDVPTLADKVKISASYMRSLDNGNRQNVSPPVFVRLCGALRLRADRRHTLMRDPEAGREAGQAVDDLAKAAA